MSIFNQEQVEAELKRLQPCKPQQHRLNSIVDQLPSQQSITRGETASQRLSRSLTWFLTWLAPAGAVAALCAGLYLKHQRITPPQKLGSPTATASSHPVLKADRVEIDRQLVADFHAVAKLPSGEPVRFRCEQWMDKVRWRDSAKGVVIEQTTPRLEIVPVRFETY